MRGSHRDYMGYIGSNTANIAPTMKNQEETKKLRLLLGAYRA